MSLPSLSMIISCCFLLTMVLLRSSSTYVINTNDFNNNLIDQEFGLNIPSYFYDRNIRATKFPRIGRSLIDSNQLSSNEFNDMLSEENQERSVLFPRIGKRAFHNLQWTNTRPSSHRLFDHQDRYQLNGYDYHIHHVRPLGLARYRTK